MIRANRDSLTTMGFSLFLHVVILTALSFVVFQGPLANLQMVLDTVFEDEDRTQEEFAHEVEESTVAAETVNFVSGPTAMGAMAATGTGTGTGTGGGGLGVTQQKIDRVLSASDVEHVTAKLPGGAEATTFWSETEHAAVLVTRRMPDAPAGRIYQVWLQKGDDMVPAAKMTKGGDNRVLLDGDPGDASGVGVTVEPEGGSAEPSSAPVALMNFDDA